MHLNKGYLEKKTSFCHNNETFDCASTHTSLKIGYKIKSKVIKSKTTTLNLGYVKQQPSRSKVEKWLPNETPYRQIGKQPQFNGEKMATRCKN
jgi:hypothetical protein